MDPSDHIAIEKLVHRYPYYLDAGMYEELGRLFAHADIYVGTDLVVGKDGPAVGALWRESVQIYPNGTPRTRHLIVNLLIDDDGPDRARAHSSVLVVQDPRGGELKVLTAGDYLDLFAKVDGEWRFVERHVGNDLFGDLSDHVTVPMTASGDIRPQRWEDTE